jgi:pimeloyl-[acyl-carrier protein] methyl ester esterase
MKYFISGWAGFKETVDVPEEWDFIVPFIDFDENGILEFFKDKSDNTIAGWSTGGHIILKNLSFFSQRFRQIIIIAGFKRFTDYVHPKIIKKMIDKLEREPTEVVRDFLLKAGCKPIVPKKIEEEKLKEGLKFLLTSEVSNFAIEHTKLTLIHGRNDKILPLTALEDLKLCYPFANAHIVEGFHWITFNEIMKIKALD